MEEEGKDCEHLLLGPTCFYSTISDCSTGTGDEGSVLQGENFQEIGKLCCPGDILDLFHGGAVTGVLGPAPQQKVQGVSRVGPLLEVLEHTKRQWAHSLKDKILGHYH